MICISNFRSLIGSVVLIFAFALAAVAQVTTAGITGTVEDSTGRVVPGANVTITHTATNQSRTVTSNDSGSFSITNLQPGRYTVSVEAATFSRAVIKDVELNVGTTRTMLVELKAGEISEVVEIIGDDILIETTRSDIDTSISPKEIENLPLLNRTFSNLSVIAPEARPVGNFDPTVGSSRVDLQACKLEYSIVSPK